MTELERLIKAQPWCDVPPEWRREILANARQSSWRELLWPSPTVWAAMAAVWAIFLGVQTGLIPEGSESPAGRSRATAAEPAPEQISRSFHLTSTDYPLFASLP